MSRRMHWSWSVQVAESCGWLLDIDADLVQTFLGRRDMQPSATRADVNARAIPAIRSMITLGNLAPDAVWSFETSPLFWESAQALSEGEDVAIVAVLLDRLIRAPENTPPLSHKVRVIKMPMARVKSRGVTGVRIAYVLQEDAKTVCLLHVERYDSAIDDAKLAAKLSQRHDRAAG